MKALLSAVLLSVIGVPAYSDNNGAFVIDLGSETCVVPDGDFNPVFASQAQVTATLSENNNMLLSCRASNPDYAASDGETTQFKGFNCGGQHPLIGPMVTNHSHVVVTSGGNVHMKCHFKIGS
jgi:hypothetical protein